MPACEQMGLPSDVNAIDQTPNSASVGTRNIFTINPSKLPNCSNLYRSAQLLRENNPACFLSTNI